MAFGDEGGGFDIALRGIRAAVRALDGRGESTRLLKDAAAHFGFSLDRDSVLAALPSMSRRHILASFAPVVILAAKSGDYVAGEIIKQAVCEQALCILTAARSIFKNHDEFPVALHGSVACNDMVANGIHAKVSAEFDNARFLLPNCSPAIGLAIFTLNELLENANKA